jgi:predicted dinucleotide-binding enzyme
MRIGVLGTGRAGQTLASRFVSLGHETRMGARAPGGENATQWVGANGERASEGSFADAAAFGEVVVNATAGAFSLDALRAAGPAGLAGKPLIDVANPLDFSHGMPPTLSIANDDSLGEAIQREFPDARVVKTLNTVNAAVMVQPSIVGGSHTVFLCGNDPEAKALVTGMLGDFGWPPGYILDLGDISAARGMEMYLPLWLRLWQATGTAQLNVQVRTA